MQKLKNQKGYNKIKKYLLKFIKIHKRQYNLKKVKNIN